MQKKIEEYKKFLDRFFEYYNQIKDDEDFIPGSGIMWKDGVHIVKYKEGYLFIDGKTCVPFTNEMIHNRDFLIDMRIKFYGTKEVTED